MNLLKKTLGFQRLLPHFEKKPLHHHSHPTNITLTKLVRQDKKIGFTLCLATLHFTPFPSFTSHQPTHPTELELSPEKIFRSECEIHGKKIVKCSTCSGKSMGRGRKRESVDMI